MKKIIIIFLCSLLCSCYSYRNNSYNYDYDGAQKETLIKICAKMIQRGSLEFLRYENGDYRVLVYSYRLDTKNGTPYCALSFDSLYNTDRLIAVSEGRGWMTSQMFKQCGNHDPYFRLFSEDFLDISNEEKIKVLDSVSKR